MSREHLVDMLGEIPRPAIQRAALIGRVECLGLFDRIVQGDTRSAWMFIVRGSKKKWYVAAMMCDRNQVAFRILKKVPWQYYRGGKGLAGGDDPMKYHLKKAFASTKFKGGMNETLPEDEKGKGRR